MISFFFWITIQVGTRIWKPWERHQQEATAAFYQIICVDRTVLWFWLIQTYLVRYYHYLDHKWAVTFLVTINAFYSQYLTEKSQKLCKVLSCINCTYSKVFSVFFLSTLCKYSRLFAIEHVELMLYIRVIYTTWWRGLKLLLWVYKHCSTVVDASVPSLLQYLSKPDDTLTLQLMKI